MTDDRLIGRILGKRFEIVRLLGRGAMGSVYEAKHLGLDSHVALKILNWEYGEDAEMRERFLSEPRMAVKTRHPNIIRVTDIEDDGDLLYIVMELVEGSDLRDVLRAGAIEPIRALRLIEQAAAGIDFAHARGLVHRDVKPANILVGPDDSVVLTDFGLARSSGASRRLTRSGGFFGTLAYAAPEQFDERGAEPASDRYALACVLWECLTGRVPFDGESESQVMRGHLDAPVPQLGGDLPPALDGVFVIALAKDPAARFATAHAFVTATRAALAEPWPAAAPDRGHTVHGERRPERPALATSAAAAEHRPMPVGDRGMEHGTKLRNRTFVRPEVDRDDPPATPVGAAARLGGALRMPAAAGGHKRLLAGLLALVCVAVVVATAVAATRGGGGDRRAGDQVAGTSTVSTTPAASGDDAQVDAGSTATSTPEVETGATLGASTPPPAAPPAITPPPANPAPARARGGAARIVAQATHTTPTATTSVKQPSGSSTPSATSTSTGRQTVAPSTPPKKPATTKSPPANGGDGLTGSASGDPGDGLTGSPGP